MKIAFVVANTLREKSAGTEQAVYFLAKQLIKKGCAVEIYCTADKPRHNVSFDGVPLHEFPRMAPTEAYYFSGPLYHALKQSDADIIHAYSYNSLTTPLAILAKRKNQTFVMTLASSVSSSLFRKLFHPLLDVFYSLFQKKIDAFICVSQWECDVFQKRISSNSKKWSVIPCGIDMKDMRKSKRKKEPETILTVARLVKNKGVHRLIAAMPFVLEKKPNAKLWVVGDGPERAALEGQSKKLGVEQCITFFGRIELHEREKLLDLYSRADVFSMLADSESQGIVYGLGVASGASVLVPYQTAMKELVDAGCAVGVDEINTPSIVAQKIIDLFDHPHHARGIDTVIWSWARVGDAAYSVYEKLLQKNKSR